MPTLSSLGHVVGTILPNLWTGSHLGLGGVSWLRGWYILQAGWYTIQDTWSGSHRCDHSFRSSSVTSTVSG